MRQTIEYVLKGMWKDDRKIPNDSLIDQITINKDEKGLFAHYITVVDSDVANIHFFRSLRLNNAWVEALSRIADEEGFSLEDLIRSEKSEEKEEGSFFSGFLFSHIIFPGIIFVVFLIIVQFFLFAGERSLLRKISLYCFPVLAIALLIFLSNASGRKMKKRLKYSLKIPSSNHTADYIYEELHNLQKIRTTPVLQSANKPILWALSLLTAFTLAASVLPDYSFASFDTKLAVTLSETRDEAEIARFLQTRNAERSKNSLLQYLDEQGLSSSYPSDIGNAICLLGDTGFYTSAQQQELLDRLMTVAMPSDRYMNADDYSLFLTRCSADFRNAYPILYSENAKEEMSAPQLTVLKTIYADYTVSELFPYWKALYASGFTNSANTLLYETAPAVSLDDLRVLADKMDDADRKLLFQAYSSFFTSIHDVFEYLAIAASYGMDASQIAPEGIPVDLDLSHCIANGEAVNAWPDLNGRILPLIRIEDEEAFGSSSAPAHTEADSEYFTILLDTQAYDALPESLRPQSLDQAELYLIYDEQYEEQGSIQIKRAYGLESYPTYALVQRINLHHAVSGELIYQLYEKRNDPREYWKVYDISSKVSRTLMSQDPKAAALADVINLMEAIDSLKERYAFGEADKKWAQTYQADAIDQIKRQYEN